MVTRKPYEAATATAAAAATTGAGHFGHKTLRHHKIGAEV